MNITHPIYAVSTHNYSPKVARVIETRGSTLQAFICELPETQLNVDAVKHVYVSD
jgi:hypothetical protein